MYAVFKVGDRSKNRYVALFTSLLLLVIAAVYGGHVYAHSDEKIILISDVDDTAIQSNVENKLALVTNVLLRKPKNAFGGMASLYQTILAENPNTTLKYLSATPTMMRKSMQNLLDKHEFPNGELILRPWIPVISDIGLWGDTIFSSKEYKLKKLRKIFSENPDEKFILVGDDVEFDADIYTQISREFPGQVKQIYIRRVIGRLPLNTEDTGIRQFSTEFHIAIFEWHAGRLSEQAVMAIGQKVIELAHKHPLSILPKFVKSFIHFDETAEHIYGVSLSARFKALLADMNRALTSITHCTTLLLGHHDKDETDASTTPDSDTNHIL